MGSSTFFNDPAQRLLNPVLADDYEGLIGNTEACRLSVRCKADLLPNKGPVLKPSPIAQSHRHEYPHSRPAGIGQSVR